MYEFMLLVKLQDPAGLPEQYLSALRNAGCDDALVGIGRPGAIGLSFIRVADTLRAAINEAVGQVKKAIPDIERIHIWLQPTFKGPTAMQAVDQALKPVDWMQDDANGGDFMDVFETLKGKDADDMATYFIRELEEAQHRPDTFERVLCYRLPPMEKEEMAHILAILQEYEGYHYCLFTVHHPEAGDFDVVCAGNQFDVEMVQADLEALMPRLPQQ